MTKMCEKENKERKQTLITSQLEAPLSEVASCKREKMFDYQTADQFLLPPVLNLELFLLLSKSCFLTKFKIIFVVGWLFRC